jgi:hypothetical protein
VASCKLHGVNPFDYLRDVLVRIGEHPARDVLALSPKKLEKASQGLRRWAVHDRCGLNAFDSRTQSCRSAAFDRRVGVTGRIHF